MTDRDMRFANDNNTEGPSERTIILEQPAATPLSSLSSKPTAQMPQKRHMHLFDAYCEEPHAVNFQTQEADEYILLFLRKSHIVNLPWMIFTLLLLVAPFVFFSVKEYLFPFPIPANVLTLFLAFYYLLTFAYAFINFIIWYFNAALITNKRIIDIDFHQLVYKDVAETKLSLVQDVSYRQTSVMSNLFDFGHVLIQTAGTIENFEFDALPKPEKIAEIVENLIGRGRVYVP